MIQQLEIKNFRCFEQAKLHGFKRFNVIVGESGTGKTAFLESLFLCGAGNPEVWFRIRRWRGLGEGPIQLGMRENYEALFRDLFYGFNQKKGANITIHDSDKGKRELEIFYESSDIYALPVGKESPENAFAIEPITFRWDFGNRVVTSKVEFKDGALRMLGNAEVYPIFLISPVAVSARENAQCYSNLSRVKKAGPVLAALKKIFKQVESISIELAAGEPSIHVSMTGLNELLPIGDLSGGLSKYLSIVLAILTVPGGVVLVDEIENGFYYESMPELLRSIVELCDDRQVQLFATTHSYEFLKVMADAMPAAKRGAEDYLLLRLEKELLEPPKIRAIPGKSYVAAVKEGLEIR